jgi:hypothetical protein
MAHSVYNSLAHRTRLSLLFSVSCEIWCSDRRGPTPYFRRRRESAVARCQCARLSRAAGAGGGARCRQRPDRRPPRAARRPEYSTCVVARRASRSVSCVDSPLTSFLIGFSSTPNSLSCAVIVRGGMRLARFRVHMHGFAICVRPSSQRHHSHAHSPTLRARLFDPRHTHAHSFPALADPPRVTHSRTAPPQAAAPQAFVASPSAGNGWRSPPRA